jgi:hypothetical protein
MEDVLTAINKKRFESDTREPGSIRRLIYLLVFIFSLGAILIRTTGTSAQSPTPPSSVNSVAIQTFPAFGGNFKYGEWLLLWVELENNGPDVQGLIQVRVTGGGGTMSFRVPVELPAGSRKRVPIYVLPNNFTRQLEVQVLSGGQLLASEKTPVIPSPSLNYFAGIIAPERGALSLIGSVDLPGQERPKLLADVSLSDLPERYEGLRSFDLLILNDVDTSELSPEQVSALETWVLQGGRLVVGGGAGAQKTLSGLSEMLSPVSLERTVELDAIPSLANFSGFPIRISGPFIVAAGQAHGETLVEEGNQPIVIEKALGNGSVDYVALDLSSSPFDAWNGATPFWEKILSPGAAYPEWMPIDISPRQQLASQMPYILTNLPMLDLPSAQGLALLLVVYILLIGPINYFVLRRQNKLHLAWITIPVITIIFSAASFGLGYALHGSNIFLNKASIIQLQPDGKARVDSYVGLFSPERNAYELEVRGGGLLSPMNPYYDPWNSLSSAPGLVSQQEMILTQGDPGFVSGLDVEQWSMQSFMDEGLEIDFGKVTGELRLEEELLVGSLHNSSGYTLKDAAVILGKRFVRLGDIPAGGTADIRLDLTNLGKPDFGSPLSYALFENYFTSTGGPPREVEVKRMMVENVLERIPVPIKSAAIAPRSTSTGLSHALLLLTWIDQAPPEVLVEGTVPAQQSTAMVLMPLSYQAAEEGDIVVPTGLIPGTMLKSPQEGGICGESGTTAVYMNRGDAEFQFSVPETFRDVETNTLKLGIWTDSGFFNAPEISLYDWEAEDWVTLNGIIQGINLVPDARAFTSQVGQVQVRLSSQDALQACYFLALGLEGHRR